jgi:hypothetical protein
MDRELKEILNFHFQKRQKVTLRGSREYKILARCFSPLSFPNYLRNLHFIRKIIYFLPLTSSIRNKSQEKENSAVKSPNTLDMCNRRDTSCDAKDHFDIGHAIQNNQKDLSRSVLSPKTSDPLNATPMSANANNRSDTAS